jgi:hypothetical protein
MMLELFYLEAQHHDTQIRLESGKIWAAVPHSRLTNTSSSSGDVTAIVISLGADSVEYHKKYTRNRLPGKHTCSWGSR